MPEPRPQNLELSVANAEGWWDYTNRPGDSEPHPMTFTSIQISEGRIVADGDDDFGHFQFLGRIDCGGGVSLLKHYHGGRHDGHCVRYTGSFRVSDNQMWIKGTHEFEGSFRIDIR